MGAWQVAHTPNGHDITPPPVPSARHVGLPNKLCVNCYNSIAMCVRWFFFFVYIIDNNSSFDGSLGYKAIKHLHNTRSTALFVSSRVESQGMELSLVVL